MKTSKAGNNLQEYVIKRAVSRPLLKGLWDEVPWRPANVITLSHFVDRSSSHHPKVEAKALYTEDGLFVFFRVFDRYVRAVRTEYQSSVCRDSCVEFFVEPRQGRGYFNFEINCGGTMLLYFVEDPTIIPGKGFAKFRSVPKETGDMVRIYHSMPSTVDPEIQEKVDWKIEYFIPFKVFETFLGPLGQLAGQTWRANFYKCADETSRPHWASWAPLYGKRSFHLPEYFATIHFEQDNSAPIGRM